MKFSQMTMLTMKSIPRSEQKRLGQYMTPSEMADELVESLNPPSGSTVLDPAVGTGELLLATKRFLDDDVNVVGFDADPVMVASANENVDGTIEMVDLFGREWRGREGLFDYIIANPPYFEIRKDDPRLSSLSDFEVARSKGRVNIFSLFFEYALRLLSPSGRMSFLVPPSMNNGAYFRALRNLIIRSGVVEDLRIFRENDRFENASTSTQIITIRKTSSGFSKNFAESKRFIVRISDSQDFVFTEDAPAFERFRSGKSTLSELGFSVRTGPIVWNQHVDDFVVDGVTLVYAADIVDGIIRMSPKIGDGRRHLPRSAGLVMSAPFIVVNRVVGSLSSPSLRFALVESGDFFIENHVNVITHPEPDQLRRLASSLSSINCEDMSHYLRMVTGNTQLSAKELLRIPISL